MKYLITIFFCALALMACCQVKSTTYVDGDVIVNNSDGTLDTLSSPDVQPMEYVALLSQASIAAPSANVLRNTLGVVPSWAYTTTGTYTLTSPSPIFLSSKTVCSAVLQTRGSNPRYYSCGRTADDTIVLYSMNSSLVLSDPGTSNDVIVKIQVFY